MMDKKKRIARAMKLKNRKYSVLFLNQRLNVYGQTWTQRILLSYLWMCADTIFQSDSGHPNFESVYYAM